MTLAHWLFLYAYIGVPFWNMIVLMRIAVEGPRKVVRGVFWLFTVLANMPFGALFYLGAFAHKSPRPLESITPLELGIGIAVVLGIFLFLKLVVFLLTLMWDLHTMGPRTKALLRSKTPPPEGDVTASHVRFGMVYNKKKNRLEIVNLGLTDEGLRHWEK